MQKKHFYSDMIGIQDIYVSLEELQLSSDEKQHLTTLLEANIHATVVNTVLPQLPEEEKKTFLKNLLANDHEKTWQHLNQYSQDIEAKISQSLSKLKAEILEDINQAKSKKEN
jgi:hypothetical protein